ncbi:MAG TPA: ABC transporter permease [Rhodothermales bacterium]|nr:ABC transporter permease [Rhodothermales bacterium]
MSYRFLIARRYLVSRKQITLISVITGISITGVALGVAALIVVLSVMNGFYDFVRELLVSLDPHVRIVSTGERGIPATQADSLIHISLALPHVEHASPYVEGKALLLTGGADVNKVVIVRGVDPARLKGVSEVVERTGMGSFNLGRQDGLPGIVIGMSLGQRFALVPGAGAQAGSAVSLLSAQALERALTRVFGTPMLNRFEVRGLYELEPTYDESHVFIGVPEAQQLFRMAGQVTGIELRLDDINRAEHVKEVLEGKLDSRRFSVLTWYDLQKSLYDVMLLEKWAAYLILILIVVVAAFNIVGSLTMVVVEKRSDVGVLQAMGISRKNVRNIFLLEGLLIGGVGAGLGLVLGLGLSLLQKYYEIVPLAGGDSFLINAYPVSIRATDLILIVLVSLGLCVLASIYPARRAAAIEPARAVQLEG